MATADQEAWRQFPTEVLVSCLNNTRAAGLDEVRFPTAEWYPSASRVVSCADVEAEVVARGRCD